MNQGKVLLVVALRALPACAHGSPAERPETGPGSLRAVAPPASPAAPAARTIVRVALPRSLGGPGVARPLSRYVALIQGRVVDYGSTAFPAPAVSGATVRLPD